MGTCKGKTGNGQIPTAPFGAYLPQYNVTAIQIVLANNGLVGVALNANNNFKQYL